MPVRARARYELTAEDRSKRAFRSVKRSLKETTRGFLSFRTAVVGVLGAAGLGSTISQTLRAGDEVHKLSIRLGAGTRALSEYRHVANLTGVSFRTLTTGWQRAIRRISQAARDTGVAKDALKELGLNAKQLTALAPEDQFERMADAFHELANQGDRVRLSQKLFDSEAVALLQTMKGGAKVIRAMRAEARALGMSLSQEQAEGIAAANDAMTRLSGAVRGLTQEMTIALTGPMKDFAEFLTIELKPLLFSARDAFVKLGLAIGATFATIANPFSAREILDQYIRDVRRVGRESFNVDPNAGTVSGSFGPPALSAGLGAGGAGGTAAGSLGAARTRLGEFRQVSRARTALGGPPASPQIERTNNLLKEAGETLKRIERKTGATAAVTA